MKIFVTGFCICILLCTSVCSLWGCVLYDITTFRKLDCSVEPVQKNAAAKRVLYHHHRKVGSAANRHSGSSVNWCGYSVLTNLLSPLHNAVSDVYGAWTVPVLSKLPKHAYCAVAVAIDGYDSSTTQQIGTKHHISHGKQMNYAWFEMAPGDLYQIVGFPVRAKDSVGCQIQYLNTDEGKSYFQVTIFNYTRCVWWTKDWEQTDRCPRDSASWLVESIYSPRTKTFFPLARVSPIVFSNCQATLQGYSGAINDSSWAHDLTTMKTSQNKIKASPSSLSPSGNGFTVNWIGE